MNTTLRVLLFGVVSGVIWSVVPGTLAELFRSPGATATVIVSGVLSGVLTSFVLKTPLARFGRPGAAIFGVLSLPLGAFVFGAFLSLVQWAVLGRDLTPLDAGLNFAGFSVFSYFALVLFPLAVLTTFLLRAVIVSGSRHENAA
jgi:hypothetical protein